MIDALFLVQHVPNTLHAPVRDQQRQDFQSFDGVFFLWNLDIELLCCIDYCGTCPYPARNCKRG